MRKVLILGAGIYQVPLIKKAKELGYYTIVISIKGNYPGFKYADKVYYTNTTDIEDCLSIARKESIDAVCTTGTDVALPALGHIVDNLNLFGPSEESAVVSSNKYLMKERFINGGVRTAKFCKVSSLFDCYAAAEVMGYPCVLKVVDSSGSRGISVVKNKNELEYAYSYVTGYTKKDFILVEEFLCGFDFGAQALVYKGEILFVIPHTTDVFHGYTNVPIGHTVPYSDKIDKSFESDVFEQMSKAIKALGIDNAVVNADLMCINDKTFVIEMGARCGATCLPEVDGLSYGFDMYETILKLALGDLDVSIYNNMRLKQAATALLICSPNRGVLTGYSSLSHPQLYQCKVDYCLGQNVDKFMTGPNRIGHIIVTGKTKQESENLVNELVKKLNLVIE